MNIRGYDWVCGGMMSELISNWFMSKGRGVGYELMCEDYVVNGIDGVGSYRGCYCCYGC